MPPPTANEIKSQLATLLTPVIGTAGTKKTKIIDSYEYAFRNGEDPTILRSDLDTRTLLEGAGTVQWINCLMITEAGFAQSPPTVPDPSRAETRSRGEVTIARRFRLTFFYQVGEGSENEASDIVEVIRRTLNQSPKLGFATVADYKAGPAQFIEGHDRLQVPEFVPESFGMVLAHVADMNLAVRVIEPQEA